MVDELDPAVKRRAAGLGRRGFVVAGGRRGVAAALRRDRRRSNAVPQRKLRAVSRRSPAMLCSGALVEVASALLGEPAVLYKEKVNYKQPGGAGYSPHQDAPAYPMIDTHVSALVAVDDADEGNGCLEVVSRMYDEVLPVDERGCIAADIVAELKWEPAPIKAGQTLWFHSRTPHRSGANLSSARGAPCIRRTTRCRRATAGPSTTRQQARRLRAERCGRPRPGIADRRLRRQTGLSAPTVCAVVGRPQPIPAQTVVWQRCGAVATMHRPPRGGAVW